MRKRIIFGIFAALGVSALAYQNSPYYANNVAELNSKIITEKGKQYMRFGILGSHLDRAGVSRSSQNIEMFGGIGKFDGENNYSPYDADHKGFVIGTTSQFNRIDRENFHSKWITGVSFGYINSEVDYEMRSTDEEIDTWGVNAYLGYNRNDYLVMGFLGAGLSKADVEDEDHRREDLNFGIEGGKIFQIGERAYLYPYVGFDFSGYFLSDYEIEGLKYKKNDELSSNVAVGATYFADFTKWLVKLHLKWSSALGNDEEISVTRRDGTREELSRFNIEGDAVTLNGMLGYYLAEDMLLSLEVMGVFSENYRENVFGLKLNYTF